jgi:hypothetical protein
LPVWGTAKGRIPRLRNPACRCIHICRPAITK